MVDQPGPRPSPYAYWGTIEAAATQHRTVAEMWDMIRADAERQGLPLPAGGIMAINQLRHQAQTIATAAERFARAGETDAVMAPMIAEPPWARPAGSMEALPRFQVRVEVTGVGPEGSMTQWVTHELPSLEGWTKGELLDELEAFGQEHAGTYDLAFGGLGTVQILQV